MKFYHIPDNYLPKNIFYNNIPYFIIIKLLKKYVNYVVAYRMHLINKVTYKKKNIKQAKFDISFPY